MPLCINHNIQKIKPSASIAMMEKARALKDQGMHVISLAGGEPDFDTPAPVVEACYKAIRDGYTHYAVGKGLLPFRERLCRKLREQNGILCEPDSILVTPGGKYAIFLAINTFLNPGDEVLILDPSWVSYAPIVEMAGGVPVRIPLSFTDNYTIHRERLEDACTEKTKMIILNTPNNPTGRVLTWEEAAELEQFLLKHDILLISDEVYEEIIFDGRRHISMGSVPSVAEKVITVNSFSKCAAMTGWRVGYLCAAKGLVDAMYLCYQHTLTCISAFSQIAAMTALDCTDDMRRMRESYEYRRSLLCQGLSQLPGVTCRIPEGAFYAWVKIQKDGMNDIQIAEYLLDRAQVVTVAGSGYGLGSEACVRMCFAAAETELLESVQRLRAVL